MRNASVWQRVLGLVATVIEGMFFDEEADAIIVSVRPRKGGPPAMRALRHPSAVV